MISFIYLFEINSVVIPNSWILFWITEFVAYTAAANHNGIKALSANGVRSFFINGTPNFINGRRKLPRTLPFWLITFPVITFNKINLIS